MLWGSWVGRSGGGTTLQSVPLQLVTHLHGHASRGSTARPAIPAPGPSSLPPTQEYNTSAFIRSTLDELGIPYQYPVAKTGLVGRIGSGKPLVILRSDIDALPIEEPEGLEFRSTHHGRMHACGHDGEWWFAGAV